MANEFPKIQYSAFVGKDQIVLRGDTADEIADNVNALVDEIEGNPSRISDILNGIKMIRAAALVIDPVSASAAAPNPPSTQPERGAYKPREATHSPQPSGGKSCNICGAPATFRSGTNAVTGKQWEGWFCQDRTHKPQFGK